jgi:hypothetical protein
LFYGLVNQLKFAKLTHVQFFQNGCLATALLLGPYGSLTGKASAMQSPKIGTVICQPGSEIDPYSFWGKIRHDDVTKSIELKYEELKDIDQLASWLSCRGFLTKVNRSLDVRYSYVLNSSFSRLKNGKYVRPPLWGFDIPMFKGAWGYSIVVYFNKNLSISNASIENLWN